MNEEARRAAAVAFGRRVAEARRGREMTQGELARVLGVTQQYVSAVEKGSENLTLLTMTRIADVFGLDLSDMLRT